ncbi:MAG: PD-(D/E)XK nuclease family protein [Candidatus Omnitrophota bacterium]
MKRNPNQYSNSEISTYEKCKLKYQLQYLTDTESSFDTIEAFMGSRVHDALEKLYLDIRMAKLMSLDDLLAFYNEIWNKHWNNNIHIVKKEYDKDDYRRKGEKCLQDYYDKYAPFDQERTIAMEKDFKFNINEKYAIFGIIDRIAKAEDGTFIIHDYKTSNMLPTQEEIDNDRQLPLYRLGIMSLWPEAKKVKLVYHYLTFNEELSPSIDKSLEEEGKFKANIIEIIKTIETTKEFMPEPSNLCNWCDYQPHCPKRKHLFKVESLPQELYHKDDGVKLVDEYVKLWSQEKEISQAIEETKAKIIQYAKQENIEAIKGSNYKIYAKSRVEKNFPGKDDPGRKELEDWIKSIGKWEKVSILWISFLKKELESRKWSQEFVEKANSFLIEKENNWISQPYKLSIG